MCEIKALNVTGSSAAEARAGAEQPGWGKWEGGGRPLCDPGTKSPFCEHMRGLETAAPRLRPALPQLPLEASGLADWPPYLQGFIKLCVHNEVNQETQGEAGPSRPSAS